MKSLEDFKIECPASWKGFGPGWRTVAVIYFFDNDGRGLSKKELSEKIELNDDELKRGLGAMQQTNEILFRENATGRRYYLEPKTREAFKGLYNL